MHPDIIRLAIGETDTPIPICTIPPEVARALGSSARWVNFSKSNLDKQFAHHPEFRIHHVEAYGWIITNGAAYLEKMVEPYIFCRRFEPNFGILIR